MIALHSRVEIEDALQSSLDCRLRALISACIKQDIGSSTFDLMSFTSIVVAQPGDTETSIRRELGFSPLRNTWTGARFGTPKYEPCFDVLQPHPGFWEVIWTLGNDGFAFVLFVEDAEGVEPELLSLCRTYVR